MLMFASVPLAVAGSLVAGYIAESWLKGILGVGLLVIAAAFVRHRADHNESDEAIARGEGVVEPSVARKIVTSDGTTYEYALCRTGEGRAFAGLGGLLVGLISTGSAGKSGECVRRSAIARNNLCLHAPRRLSRSSR